MFNSVNVFAEHKDLIHDVSYSHSGKRLATCSSDQSVKVWDLGVNGQWQCSASWKTHCGSVWRVIWAHPEFGQILATCSFDRTALIWEEVLSETDAVSTRRGGRGHTHWLKRSTLVDSRSNVTDIKFAPRHLGLQLATVSQSGMLRVYEAVDVVNLSQWSLQDEVGVGGSVPARCSALSWSQSRSHPPLIAVSSDDPQAPGGKVSIFLLQDSVSSTKKKWGKVETLGTITDAAYDVAFAPAIGRSFHLLAVASKNLHIFALKPLPHRNPSSSAPSDITLISLPKFEVKEIAKLDTLNSQVTLAHPREGKTGGFEIWRVSWNVTGTILSSTGSDGCVKLWKANHEGQWNCIGTMKPGESRLDQSPKGEGRYY